MTTKVVKNGTVVTADRTWKADILIEGETIKEIGPDLKGDEVIDAEGAYVIPGGIDPHTHMEMPFMGTTAAETFETGTWAAACGGTTMLVDFCLPGPDGSLKNAINSWHDKSRDQICTDIGYHMAVTGWNETIFNEMKDAVEMGVNSFKHFMAYKGALMIEDDEMFASFKRCKELGALPMVHAENGDIVADLQQQMLEQGITGPEGHAYSRPPEVEGEAANRAIMIADAAGVPLYIVHVSCEQAHEAIRRARQKGQRVYGEPLAQFLTLDESEYFNKDWDHAARRVMSPPFRNKQHQDGLWAGLAAGSLQVVATDHAAFSTEQKRMGVGDFTKIPNGSNGLEERLAVLWTEGVEKGRLTRGRDLRDGHLGGGLRGHDDAGGLLPARPGRQPQERDQQLARQVARPDLHRYRLSHGGDGLERDDLQRDEGRRRDGRQFLQAFHGLQGRADDRG